MGRQKQDSLYPLQFAGGNLAAKGTDFVLGACNQNGPLYVAGDRFRSLGRD
jgi:hypothetical protein